MTVGQLRTMIAHLPDNWQVFSFNEQNPAGELLCDKTADVVESDKAVFVPVSERLLDEKDEMIEREDLHKLFLRAGIIRAGFVNWRFVKRETGEINALDRLRGVIVATDGVECLVEREDGSCFIGHFEWFVPDRVAYAKERNGSVRKEKQKPLEQSTMTFSLDLD